MNIPEEIKDEELVTILEDSCDYFDVFEYGLDVGIADLNRFNITISC
jgi:hypothetical protein